MATQIFGDDHAVLLGKAAEKRKQQAAAAVTREPRVGAFRGLLYAMLFNVFLLAIAAGAWELWRIFVR